MGWIVPLATAMGASAQTAATLGTIGSVASAVGAGLGFVGSIQQGRASAAAGKYNAAVAMNNASIAKKNAEFRMQEGRAAVEAQQMKNRAEIGAITANQAAAGIRLDSGSALDVRSSAEQMGELNALTLRSNAARQAYGYQTEATNFEAQAELDRSRAKFDEMGSYISGGGTFLGKAGEQLSNAYDKYLGTKSFI